MDADARPSAAARGAPAGTRVPPERVPAERFTAAPSVKAIDGLTPERSAGDRPPVVERPLGRLPDRHLRDACSSSATGSTSSARRSASREPRLAAGDRAPAGRPRSSAATTSTRRTAPAATARTASAPTNPTPAEAGYIGPKLNAQEKLFAHLNEDYLRNVLHGRRPLRLRQRQLGDAGLVGPGQSARSAELPPDRRAHRVPPGDERRTSTSSRTRSLNEPVIDPETGEEKTFTGLARPELQAGAGRDAVPRLLPRRARRRRRRERRPARLDRPERAGRDRHGADGAATPRLRPDDARGQRPTPPSPSSSTTRTRPARTTS